MDIATVAALVIACPLSLRPLADAHAAPCVEPTALGASQSPASPTRPGDATAARLAADLPGLMDEAVVAGAQVALVHEGALGWRAAFGVANARTGVPVTDTSVFEAASLTKPLFAYAVLTLADEGRLDLDTPLTTYLPGRYDLESNDLLKLVTARHVLSHRTGFPNWRPGGQPLIHFAPGERFSYSGEGFVYLAAAVERITGETIEAFVRRRVFEPLGMTSSSLVWQGRYESLKVHGHGN
jgi:CubicO group peptidase (beta-lactamase class C family)